MSRVAGFYRFSRAVLTPLMTPWIRYEVTGVENIPTDGGFLLVSNHLSLVDPLCSCWFFMKRDVPVRFMAKKSMFSVPFFGWIFKGMGLIPVNRESSPSQALEPTRQALLGGEVVGIYPEGTLTRDPQLWPMKFKTGAARLALDTRVPVILLAQWGAQDIMGPYSKKIDFRFGRQLKYSFLEPVDLSDLYSEEGSGNREAVEAATERIQHAIVRGVAQLRGEEAPGTIWDPYTQAGPWWEYEQAQAAKKRRKDARSQR